MSEPGVPAPRDPRLAEFEAHTRAARTALPGPGYLDWLQWLHDRLRPAAYAEVGVASGASLALARPETRAVGVDPRPDVRQPLPPRAEVFPVPSDGFFASGTAARVLGADRLGLAFVDGLHQAAQALRDVVHLERFCLPGAVIAVHDVWPISEEVASPDRRTVFWTGDVYKALLALADVRPGLRVAVVPCFPSGLALVTGLDPGDATAPEAYAAAVARWQPVGFAAAFAELRRRATVLDNQLAAFARYSAAFPPA